MSKRISVADLNVDSYSKSELMDAIENRITSGQKTFMTTLYSEFLYASLQDRETRAMLNTAEIAVPDGIGVIWAQYFLSRPFSVNNFYLKIIQAWWQVAYTGASILLWPKRLYQVFPEKIVGADLVWDLAELAENKNHTVYLLGWPQQKTEAVKAALLKKFPKLQVVGNADAEPGDSKVLDEINRLKPDMVLVAYGPIKQEKWIVRNLPNLPVKFAVGLGGTFDYMLGKVAVPPAWIRGSGLEWLYRLFTQPKRARRIFNATYGLILSLVRYKVFMSMPYRKNAVAVVVNNQNKVLVCKRSFVPPRAGHRAVSLGEYWQFPQGGLDDGESLIDGAKRELAEETGIVSVRYLGTASCLNSYLWEHAVRDMIGNILKYRGQEQQTVFFKFEGVDEEIKLDTDELMDYRWVEIHDALNVLAEERVHHASQVLAELKMLLLKDS